MPVSKDDEIEREIQGLLIEFDVPPSSRDMIAMMLRSYVQQLIHTREEQSINKFCVDLAHKVEMSFKIHPPGHIVMPVGGRGTQHRT